MKSEQRIQFLDCSGKWKTWVAGELSEEADTSKAPDVRKGTQMIGVENHEVNFDGNKEPCNSSIRKEVF